MRNDRELSELQPAAVYDLFYEAGTALRSALLQAKRKALRQGNSIQAEQYDQEDLHLIKERRSVRSDDMKRQILLYEDWRNRRKDIKKSLASDTDIRQ